MPHGLDTQGLNLKIVEEEEDDEDDETNSDDVAS